MKYQLPFPGVGIKAMSHDDYHKVDAYNASRLKVVANGSLRALWHYDNSESQPTAAMLFGTAFHSRILEYDDYQKRAGKIPGLKANAQAATFAKAQAEFPDKIILADGWADRIESMRDAVVEHREARKLLCANGLNETCLFWEEDGLPCRAKADRIIPGYGFVDVKTCSDASMDGFQRKANDLGYWLSAAWYTRGWLKLGLGPRPRYTMVAVETDEPYHVAVYEYDQDAIECGWIECEHAMRLIREHGYPEKRPGYPEVVMPLSLGWASRKYEGRSASQALEVVA